ncbi:MAG: gluconokinase [Betaproteobacteria bacterium]|nr:gluconokinase [Betaproteobacteria bacterium]
MIVVVMGVSGSGKSTIGPALARALEVPYLDADDFHPPENVAKMAAGVPLGDADRAPWLARMNERLRTLDRQGESAVLGCSALKERYRRVLREGVRDFRLVYLHAPFEVISRRVAQRQHRYMPASLLASQFDTLEPPDEAISIDVSQPLERCVALAVSGLRG